MTRFQVVGGSLLEQRFRLTLRVHNPNERDLVLESLRFEMLAGESRLASGGSAEQVTIPKTGDAMLEVEGNSRLIELLGEAPDMFDASGKLHYRLRGEAQVKGYGTLPFDSSSELDVGRLLKRGSGR